TYKATVQDEDSEEPMMKQKGKKGAKISKKNKEPQLQMAKGNNSMLGQVVGIIIGSPEFQRR
ncbi:MAG TPA: hypothetical protein VEB42_11255, partial [Chitinophagaceae bacterium]|nr:hypothetical protein [Chitinophagaceae bacterium]